jgi:glycosyltransferase involved in cell wall biosynthesis
VFVCSKVYKDLYKNFHLSKKKLCIVDNGIDLSRFLKIRRQPIGDTVTFGKIGRFDPVKDHDNLIRAFSILKKRYARVKMRLLGDGESRHGMEVLTKKLGIADDVIFEGFSRYTDQFLSRIDIYVISSRSEGLPLTLIESMGAALPIVATAVGGIPEIVEKARCGWLCPPSDPDKLAGAMEKALMASDLKKIGERSRKAAVDYYSLERMTCNYEQLYTQLLASRGA